MWYTFKSSLFISANSFFFSQTDGMDIQVRSGKEEVSVIVDGKVVNVHRYSFI